MRNYSNLKKTLEPLLDKRVLEFFVILTIAFFSMYTDSYLYIVLILSYSVFTGLTLKQDTDSSIGIKLDYRVLLVFILVVGLYLRINGLSDRSFWFDETISGVLTRSFLENGVPQHSSGWTTWRSFPHIFLMSVSATMFGFSDFSLRLASVFISLITIIVVFYAGKEMYSKEVGLLSAGIIAVLAFQIKWAQMARMYALFQLLYFASVFYLYKSGESSEKTSILILTTLTVLAMLTHATAYILPFIVLIYLLYLKGLNKLKEIVLNYGTIFLFFIIITEFYMGYSDVIRNFTFDQLAISIYLKWIWQDLSVLIVLSIIGFISTFRGERDVAVLFVLSIFPAAIVHMILTPRAAARYLYFTLPFLSILSAVGTVKIVSQLSQKQLNKVFVGIGIVILVAVSQPAEISKVGMMGEMPDHKSAYSYVEDRADQNDVLISDLPVPASYYYRDPDATLITEYSEDELIRGDQEAYSGSQVINSSSQLSEKISSNNEGWVVLSVGGYQVWEDAVEESLGKPVFESDKIKVWRWRQ